MYKGGVGVISVIPPPAPLLSRNRNIDLLLAIKLKYATLHPFCRSYIRCSIKRNATKQL